ncbi:integrase, catalytic region, zinc finger, CCHC-type containing protein [Tanacetum coccineum]
MLALKTRACRQDFILQHMLILLALVAQQQPVYHHQNHPTQNTQYSSTRSQQSTRNRGKAIVTSSAPTYDPEPATGTEDEEMSKEKEIDKLMALISLSFKKIYKPTNNNLRTSSNTSRANQDNSPRITRGTGYDNQRAVNVAGARENVGTPVVQKSGIQCYNCKEYGHVSRECQKPKRVKDAAYHKEKMLLCKQEEAGVQLNAEQADWKDDTDDESDDQELEAHYMYMAQLQEVTPDQVDNSGPIFDDEPMHKVQNNNDNYNVFAMENEHPEQPESSNDIYLAEHGDTNITIDSLDICYDSVQDDQDETDDLDQERDLLASLIQKLKCEIDDSKNRNKFLESSNKELVDKLKGEIEDFKTKNKSLESSNNHFKEANNELSKTNQLMFKDLKKFQAELDKYNDVNYASKVEIDCAKAKGDLMSYKIDFEKSSNAYTQKINDLNQTISDMKKELCAHQETISIMSQAKEAQIKLYKTREDKELDKVIALENKVKVLNDIVYKTGQSVQTMNMLNRNCKTSFAKPEFLKKAQRANPRLYDIGCYNDNLALMLAPDSDETIRLEKERRSKLSDLIRPFDYDQLNNLYDLFVPQREKSAEQHYFPKTSKMSHTSSNKEFSKESFRKQTTLLEKRMDESIPWDQKCKSSKELFKIKKSVDTIFDGVERCKQTIAKRTYFGNIDPFIQNTIEGNFGPQISRLNADLENFHLCLNEEMVADLRYFNSLEHEVDTLKSQLEIEYEHVVYESDFAGMRVQHRCRFKESTHDSRQHGKSESDSFYVNPSHTKKIFANIKKEGKDFSGRVTPLFAIMMVQATQDEGVDSGILIDSQQTPITAQPSSSRPQKKQSRRKQRKKNEVPQDETHHDDSVPIPSNDPLLSGLKRLRKVGESSRVESSKDKESLGAQEDASKQGRIKIIDETYGRLDDAKMFDTYDLHGDEVIVDMAVGEKQEKSAKINEREIDEFTPTSALTTVIDELTLAQTLIEIKAVKPKAVTTAATTTTT